MLGILFVTTRMYALLLTDKKGAPQAWEQDGKLVGMSQRPENASHRRSAVLVALACSGSGSGRHQTSSGMYAYPYIHVYGLARMRV